jgi:Yip1 domain
MTDSQPIPLAQPPRFRLDWVMGVLFKPRKTFPQVAAQSRPVWLTPMLLLTLTALVVIFITGPIKKNEALMKGPTLPPSYQYMTPEQQAQFMKAYEATQEPIFLYVFPALIALGKVWLGWLIVGGMLHLVLTLLGGRGNMGAAMNLVAWAAVPLAVRDGVRIVAMLSTHQLIANPGLSGFAPLATAGLGLYLAKILALIDLYVVWQVLLMVVGVRSANGLVLGKAWISVLVTIFLALNLQALAAFVTTLLGSLNATRPFFFF